MNSGENLTTKKVGWLHWILCRLDMTRGDWITDEHVTYWRCRTCGREDT